ncbi:MAG: heparinase II/III family protein [Anaerolineaceae bacterium]|nr:heparinase II/III family protein [Anaerolineaceae bacterium]
MLRSLNSIQVERALREEGPGPPFPPAADREAWEAVRAGLGEEECRRLIQRGEEAVRAGITALPATLFLEFQRIGERNAYDRNWGLRRRGLNWMTLAECLEYEGRFLDPLLDTAWAICEESTWAIAAHQRALTDMERPHIDLMATMTGAYLAEFDLLLGAEMEPALGVRIRHEMDRRLFTPWLQRHDFHWMYSLEERTVNNWNGVCNGNLLTAALHLEPDPARLAEMVIRAAHSMADFIDGFECDGGSTEGVSCWAFGFGNFIMAAALLEQRTNGRLSFLGDEQRMRDISRFPLRTLVSPGKWAEISDIHPDMQCPLWLLNWLAQRLDMPELHELAREQLRLGLDWNEGPLTWDLRSLLWRVAQPEVVGDECFVPARHDFYSGMHWMFARMDPADPDALVLVAKGGHNGEMHNQNDLGSIIVHHGRENLIVDPGRGRFSREYFGAGRYDLLVNQSFGHSCPVPNGQMQGPLSHVRHGDRRKDAEYHARLLEHRADETQDLLRLELADAWDEAADLESLVRTVTMKRDCLEGRIELLDEVRFANGPGMLESVLITFGEVEEGAGQVVIRGERAALRVDYDDGALQLRMEFVPQVALFVEKRDLRRIVFSFREPRQQGSIRLDIEPLPVQRGTG